MFLHFFCEELNVLRVLFKPSRPPLDAISRFPCRCQCHMVTLACPACRTLALSIAAADSVAAVTLFCCMVAVLRRRCLPKAASPQTTPPLPCHTQLSRKIASFLWGGQLSAGPANRYVQVLHRAWILHFTFTAPALHVNNCTQVPMSSGYPRMPCMPHACTHLRRCSFSGCCATSPLHGGSSEAPLLAHGSQPSDHSTSPLPYAAFV